MTAATDRLELSRARLREVLEPSEAERRRTMRARRGGHGLAGRIGAAFQALQDWWTRHPLRPVLHVAIGAAGSALKPVAQRRPLALAGLAAGAGVALTLVPWRRIVRVLPVGLVLQLAWRVASGLPANAWASLLLSRFSGLSTGGRTQTRY